MKRLHLLGAIGLFSLGLVGVAHAEVDGVNEPEYTAPGDDGSPVQGAPCDSVQASYGYYQGGGQTYAYDGQSYQYAPRYEYGDGRQPSYNYNYVPVRRPYYGRPWRRSWRWHHGYRVIVPPPARW